MQSSIVLDWRSAWWPSYRCIWCVLSVARGAAALRGARSQHNAGKVERGRAGMKASSQHLGESDMREIYRRNSGGVVVDRWGAPSSAVASGGPVGRAGAYFNPARCTERFAKPSVMQGAPLPTRCSLHRHRRKEKWNAAQWSGRARRLCTPRDPVKCL